MECVHEVDFLCLLSCEAFLNLAFGQILRPWLPGLHSFTTQAPLRERSPFSTNSTKTKHRGLMEGLHLCRHSLAHSQQPDSLSPGKCWGCSPKSASPAQEAYQSRAAVGTSTFPPKKVKHWSLNFFSLEKYLGWTSRSDKKTSRLCFVIVKYEYEIFPIWIWNAGRSIRVQAHLQNNTLFLKHFTYFGSVHHLIIQKLNPQDQDRKR